MAAAEFFTPELNAAGGSEALRKAAEKGANGKSVLDGTRAKALIEFTRCLHAEQAAIVNAARAGVPVAGARLYTTTFPCHECTKFIIGAGIIEVQYIEPYPKSLAGDLYADLVDTVAPLASASRDSGGQIEKIPFRGFLGFGPLRYDDVFKAGKRRSGTELVAHVPAVALPVGAGWSEVAVTTKEGEVVLAIDIAVAEVRRLQAATDESLQTASPGHKTVGDNQNEGESESVGGQA